MLEKEIKNQLREVFSELSNNYTLAINTDSNHPNYKELIEMLQDVAECSEKITYTLEEENFSTTEPPKLLEFSILKNNHPIGVTFRAVPGGHEFTSLILALLNADNKGKNLPDEFTKSRIEHIKGPITLTTYMSLSCTNCPDVVQALNIIAILNRDITHQAVDGALYKDEVNSLNIQSVPTVYADSKLFYVGKGTIGELVDKLESEFGTVNNIESKDEQESNSELEIKKSKNFDLIIAGGGPAGVTAAIYSARKGLNVAIVANKIGGQVNDTTSIENIPSVLETNGKQLAEDLKAHASIYKIEILENRTIESFKIEDESKILKIKGGEKIKAPQIIIATGASWRRLDITGESEYLGRGVAFCPHCDGPLFKDKEVVVVGGGNSGVEAAIDLAGTCSYVTVIEFLEKLKADRVLIEKLESLKNVTILKSTAVKEIIGDSNRVVAIKIEDRVSADESIINIDGVFIQIGLIANSHLFSSFVKCNRVGEIIVDSSCRTSHNGIFAAGDVTNVEYKQIIISMGEGAKAALAAFDERIRDI